ncbi:phage protein NinX family protein [Herminiimonas sp. CN]|uniref:phage protein NinX family protein n=1 Tax=Herminiimonas sp. CN TaxID=1349818 RepID=UPI000473E42C|nr:phage protein NinX family protein [Herminiimonas sp. CN]
MNPITREDIEHVVAEKDCSLMQAKEILRNRQQRKQVREAQNISDLKAVLFAPSGGEIMKTKTSELVGAALDWAVAKALDTEPGWDAVNSKAVLLPYSTDWALSGPLIEREDISFRKYHRPDSAAHGTYYAMTCRKSGATIVWHKDRSFRGPTPLIAAMRCYVASKLGDEVEIPEELNGPHP